MKIEKQLHLAVTDLREDEFVGVRNDDKRITDGVTYILDALVLQARGETLDVDQQETLQDAITRTHRERRTRSCIGFFAHGSAGKKL